MTQARLDDRALMDRTIALARANGAAGGLPFAAIVARDGAILAEAANGVHLSNDPSDHAEIAAIRRATAALASPRLAGHALYVVGAPCPMCLACAVMAGLDEIVYAVGLPEKDAALSRLPSSRALYRLVAEECGATAVPHRHLAGSAEAGRAMFAAWNDGREPAGS